MRSELCSSLEEKQNLIYLFGDRKIRRIEKELKLFDEEIKNAISECGDLLAQYGARCNFVDEIENLRELLIKQEAHINGKQKAQANYQVQIDALESELNAFLATVPRTIREDIESRTGVIREDIESRTGIIPRRRKLRGPEIIKIQEVKEEVPEISHINRKEIINELEPFFAVIESYRVSKTAPVIDITPYIEDKTELKVAEEPDLVVPALIEKENTPDDSKTLISLEETEKPVLKKVSGVPESAKKVFKIKSAPLTFLEKIRPSEVTLVEETEEFSETIPAPTSEIVELPPAPVFIEDPEEYSEAVSLKLSEPEIEAETNDEIFDLFNNTIIAPAPLIPESELKGQDTINKTIMIPGISENELNTPISEDTPQLTSIFEQEDASEVISEQTDANDEYIDIEVPEESSLMDLAEVLWQDPNGWMDIYALNKEQFDEVLVKNNIIDNTGIETNTQLFAGLLIKIPIVFKRNAFIEESAEMTNNITQLDSGSGFAKTA